MKRPPKQWKSREQILSAIDKARVKMQGLRYSAQEQEEAAKFYAECENKVEYDKAKYTAEFLWKKAERLEKVRLKKLQWTLAAFDTKPMFENCESVILQK